MLLGGECTAAVGLGPAAPVFVADPAAVPAVLFAAPVFAVAALLEVHSFAAAAAHGLARPALWFGADLDHAVWLCDADTNHAAWSVHHPAGEPQPPPL